MKALVLFSGGLDSSVCLGLAVKKYGADEVLALSIYYGQKHKKELEAWEKIASFYGVKRITLDLGEIFRGADCSLKYLKALTAVCWKDRPLRFPMRSILTSLPKQAARRSAHMFPSVTDCSFPPRPLLL